MLDWIRVYLDLWSDFRKEWNTYSHIGKERVPEADIFNEGFETTFCIYYRIKPSKLFQKRKTRYVQKWNVFHLSFESLHFETFYYGNLADKSK